MRRRTRVLLLLALVVMALAAFVIVSLRDTAKPGTPDLPFGFEERAALNVDTNGYIYLAREEPLGVSARMLGLSDDTLVDLMSLEGVALDPENEYVLRGEFTSARDAAFAAAAVAESQGDGGAMTDAVGNGAFLWQPDTQWTREVRSAFAVNSRVPWPEWDAGVWHTLRLLPEDVPSPAVAAGFLRNMGGLLDATLRLVGVEVSGLGSALGVVRVETVAFAAYGDVDALTAERSTEAIWGTGLDLIIVAESGYPSFVMDLLYGRFVAGAGLRETRLDGEKAHYRELDNGLYLAVIRYGRTLYLAVGASRAASEALAQSVIESQRRR